MSARLRPRQLVFRGTVPASAYVLEDTPQTRALLLRRWQPGHEVTRLGARLLWRINGPERIACDAAAGAPLVDVEGRLVGAPFDAAQVRAAVAAGEVLTVEASQAVVRAPGERIDLSTYIDMTGFQLEPVTPLGEVPPPPALALVPVAADPMRAAAGLGELTKEQREVLDALRGGRGPSQQGPSIGPIARALVSALRRLTSWLPGGAPARGGGAGPAAPARRWRWLERLDRWLDRVLDVSRLSSFLGRRQAEYLARLMDMFEHGDLDQALRHAIPLGGDADGPTRRSLSLPSPRTSLNIPLGPRSATSSTIALGNSAYLELQRKYRAAAKRLEDQGRYAEAAFVLAELLHATDEAVAMLEKHEQYRLAAELAESRELPAGLQVRLWFLAKDVARAIAVARRHHAFADAVQRLERAGKVHADSAKLLRLHWGDALASAGDFHGAVAAVWPVEAARETLARRWMDLGIAQGGAAGMRLRVKKLAAFGAGSMDAGALLETLDGEDAERSSERLALSMALRDEGAALGPLAAPLARAAIRSGLRDGFPGDIVRTALLNLAGDGALKADLPAPAALAPRLNAASPAVRITVAASDRGALPVHEAAWLPDGKMLLALGEAGARLVTRDGRTAAHFDVPAHRLVTYDAGGHALLLAPRGGAWAVTRVDLVQRTVEPLSHLRLTSFADDTDGVLWIVSEPGCVSALDLASPQLAALWRVQVPAVHILARNAFSLSLLVWGGEHLEWWRYELPSFTLRVRQEVGQSPAAWFTTTAAGNLLGLNPVGHAWVQAAVGQPVTRAVAGLVSGRDVTASSCGDWSSIVVKHAEHTSWQLVDWGTGTVRWVATFESARASTGVRLRSDVATWADADGRVLAVDLGTGQLLRSLRVR